MQLHAAVVTKRSLALALIHQLDTRACGNKLTLFILYQHCQSARPLSTRRRPANLLLHRPDCYADLLFVDVLNYAYYLARCAMHACICTHLSPPLSRTGLGLLLTESNATLFERGQSTSFISVSPPTPIPPFTYTPYTTRLPNTTE